MDCTVRLKTLEHIDERSVATFTIISEAIGTLDVQLTVEAASGHEASAQARAKLHQFARALVQALEHPNAATVA
jgi:ribosomal protein S9